MRNSVGRPCTTWTQVLVALAVCGACGGSRSGLDLPATAETSPASNGGSSANGDAGRPARGAAGGSVETGGAGNVAAGGTSSASAGAGGEPAAGGAPGGGAGSGGAAGSAGGAVVAPPWLKVQGELPPSSIFALAAASSVSGTVYAGNYDGGGVYRTTTAGAAWTSTSRGLRNGGMRALAVDPFDAASVWAGTAEGLYLSTTAGDDWSALDVGAAGYPQVTSITLDPKVKGRVYVLFSTEGLAAPQSSALYRSQDRGKSWQRLASPSGLAVSVTIDPSDSSHVLLGSYNQVELESHDAGSSFQAMANAPAKTFQIAYGGAGGILCALTLDGSQHSSDGGGSWLPGLKISANSLAVGPGPTFYATGSTGVYRSTDCAGWTLVDNHQAYRSSVDASGAVYVAVVESAFQGVRRSAGGLAAFENVNTGLGNTDAFDLILEPSTPDGLFLSANYRGIYHSRDGARTFELINGNIDHVGTSAFPLSLVYDGQTLFAFTHNVAGRVFRSSDLGVSWSSTLLQPTAGGYAFISALLADPAKTGEQLYLGTIAQGSPAVGFEVSSDQGASFQPRGDGNFNTQHLIWDKLRAGWLWAVGSPVGDGFAGSSDESLFLSRDTGQTWTPVSLPTPGHYAALAAIITPEGESVELAVDGLGILKSVDGGANWGLTGNPPGQVFQALGVDPAAPNTLYAATGPNPRLTAVGERGLYKSRDGGSSWVHADEGIVPGVVRALTVDPRNPGVVYATMESGGIYRTTSGGE